MNKINPEEVEKLLKYGAYAFLDDDPEENSQDTKDTAATSMKIEDILKNKKDKSGKKKSYTLQKSTFTVADMKDSKKDSGKNSATKKEATDGKTSASKAK